MKKQFNTIDDLITWYKDSGKPITSVLEYVKWNDYLRIQLEEATSFLNDKYLVQPLTQRLYHFINNLHEIPSNGVGWYRKFRNFGKGYDINVLQDVKNCNWEALSNSEIESYIKSTTLSVRTEVLTNWVKSRTTFLDKYSPSIPTRTVYIRHGISYPMVNFDTGKLVGTAIFRKIEKHLELDRYVLSLSDTKKKDLLKEWIKLSSKDKTSRTQQFKLCTPLINFLKKETSSNSQIALSKNFSLLVYHTLYGMDIPKCAHCGILLSNRHFDSFVMQYSLTCSHHCNNKCSQLIEKRLSNNSTNMSGYKTNVGIHEEYLCNLTARQNNLSIEHNKRIGQYFVDGVDENKQIIIEIQEKHHAYSKQFKKDQEKVKFLLSKGYKVVLVLDGWFETNTKPSKYQLLYKNYFDLMSNVFVKLANIPKGKVLTSSGWSPFLGVHKTVKSNLLTTFVTNSGKKLTLTSDHNVFYTNTLHKNISEFTKGDVIETIDGPELIIDIKSSIAEQCPLYDIVETKDRHFLANGIKIHNCVLLDEAAHIEAHLIEEFWSSVIPTVSSGKKSKILVVSTPKGVGNKFYEIYSGAESGKLKTWVPERIDWWDFPGRDEAWKQSQIELLGSEEKFHQEFDNTFLDDAASAVGASVIDRFKKEKKDPIWTSEDGEYTVFEYPDKNNLYVVGVDVGEGIGRASSVAQVLDVTDLQNIKQVAVYSSAKIEPYHFANKLYMIGQSWGLPPMLIERNNCGAQVIDALFHNHKYEKLVSYSKVSTQDRYNNTRNVGVLSHTNIKSDGIQNMRYWVNHIQTVHINDPFTISEFETFVRFPNGTFRKKSDLFFDDRIMALVWALFILESELCQQYFEIVDVDLQHKPMVIKDTGLWEKIEQFYELKDLGALASIIPKPFNPGHEAAFPTLGITNKDIEQGDKYEADLDELLQMGYEFF